MSTHRVDNLSVLKDLVKADSLEEIGTSWSRAGSLHAPAWEAGILPTELPPHFDRPNYNTTHGLFNREDIQA